jgi:hypothetical protein
MLIFKYSDMFICIVYYIIILLFAGVVV